MRANHDAGLVKEFWFQGFDAEMVQVEDSSKYTVRRLGILEKHKEIALGQCPSARLMHDCTGALHNYAEHEHTRARHVHRSA